VNKDYRGVNREVWGILHRLYGGGPIVVREDPMNIYSRDLQREHYACFNNRSRPAGAVDHKISKLSQTNIFSS
jgi:hypothetical protein